MGLTGMIFGDWIAARAAVRIHGADQNEALNTCRRHAGERFFHQRRMRGELIVGHAHQIDHGLQTGGRSADRSRVVWIPRDDFRMRVVAESRFKRRARAADHPVIPARRAQRRRDDLTCRARGSE